MLRRFLFRSPLNAGYRLFAFAATMRSSTMGRATMRCCGMGATMRCAASRCLGVGSAMRRATMRRCGVGVPCGGAPVRCAAVAGAYNR